MKKIYIFFAATLLFSFAGCKKETGVPVTITFDAQLESAGRTNAKSIQDTKVYIDNTNKPCWTDGDAIRVNNGDGTVSNISTSNASCARFTVTIDKPEDHAYFAVYPSFIGHENNIIASNTGYDLHATQKVFLPRVQNYQVSDGKQVINAPMFAYNREQPTLQFHNLCGLMKITVTNDKAWDMVLDSIQVESTHYQLWGEMNITDPTYPTTGSMQMAVLNAPASTAVDSFDVAGRNLNTVSLVGMNKTLRSTQLASNRDGISSNHTSADYYIYLPVIPSGTSNLFYIRVFSHPVWKSTSSTYTEDPEVHISYEKRQTASTNAYISRNEIVPVSISLSTCKPTFTSLKAFSVSSTKTVSLSRGHIQYYITSYTPSNTASEDNPGQDGTSSSGHWRFTPRQWDFLHMTQLRHNDYHTNMWIEHFTWDSGNKPLHHWVAAQEHSAANTSFNTWGGDWGANFTNATNSSTWYTLEQSEYEYLLKERTPTNLNSDKCFGWVCITDGVTDGYTPGSIFPLYGNSPNYLFGILIIPDDFYTFHNQNYNILHDVFNLTLATGDNTLGGFKFYNSKIGNTLYRHRDDNYFTKEQLEYFEAMGCIFMPCIGSFNGLGGAGTTRLWNTAGPESDYWTKTKRNNSANDALMLMLEADATNAADCRVGGQQTSDGECYRKFQVRLVRDYHNNNGADYKYDPFQ